MRNLDYKSLFKNYSQLESSNFLDRYINVENFEDYLTEEIFPVYKHDVIGHSESGRPIYSIDIGQGSKKILIWSQMHGNESTTTKAILDFLNFLRYNSSENFVEYLQHSCHIKILPMLNPDGASKYTRFNANQIDLNRDAINQSQKETQCFFKCLEAFNPDFCFNLHGQRTIFSVGGQNKPATMSFLAPSYNYELNINQSREKSMKLIVAAHKMLKDFIPEQVGRYDDAHNPNCFGDQIQRRGIPTVLFEAGHYPNDYQRNMTKKFVMFSLVKMLECIAYSNFDTYNLEDYTRIPENKESFLDVIVENVKNTKSGRLGIQFNEVLKNDSIEFTPFVKQLDDLSRLHAHRLIDAQNKTVFINDKTNFDVNEQIKDFRIGDKKFKLKL